ncbi:hypothetical protein [Burkholderia gladioli]|uniref:hypothetical protein n=1 Tax=Burkholderia gladioli TaxID=28095 RepID=UPI0005C5BE08|nr:hypothetical protein [Burkholderia gladioli]MBW5285083.1 hypothetical protein [Burkholderia gladioli]
MKLSSMFKWAKDLVGKPEPSGVFKLGHGVAAPTTGMGKSPFSDAIVKTLASIGACSGDIVEVNEFGAARVVGRRPQLAGGRPDASERAIREALRRIYGNDAAGLDNVTVTAGANVVVFRRTKNA